MTLKRFFSIAAVSVVLLLPTLGQADNLLKVYSQAVANDPTFKQAESTWWSAKQNLPIAISAYLPQADVTGGEHDGVGWRGDRQHERAARRQRGGDQ